MKKIFNILLTIIMLSFSACAKAENKISMDDLKGTIWIDSVRGQGASYDDRRMITIVRDAEVVDGDKHAFDIAVSKDGRHLMHTNVSEDNEKVDYVLKDIASGRALATYDLTSRLVNAGIVIGKDKFYYVKDDSGINSDADRKNQLFNIYCYDIESNEEVKLTNFVKKGHRINSLVLSDDNSKLAFAYAENNDWHSTMLLNVMDLESKEIKAYKYSVVRLSFTNDSAEVIFNGLRYKDGQRLSESRMTILNIETGEETIIPYEDGNDRNYATEFAVSPDGKYIAFIRGLVGGKQLWVMHRDGTGQVRIPIPGIEGNLAWTE